MLQVGEKNFRLQPRIREDDGLQIVLQKFLRDARGFIDVAAADPQRAIDDGRIVKNKSFLRGGSAVGVEDFDFRFEKARREVTRIGDGRGATNELRIAAIESRDAAEPAQNVAQVAAEDSPIGVQFIENDISQIFEEARPARVMRQDSGVQHVGVGQDDVPFFTNRTARVGGSVAVVSENTKAIFQTLSKVVEFGELILESVTDLVEL